MLYHKTYKHSNSKTWVVFVHGAGGSNAVWFRQLREFKKHFNVLLVDLRGHGKSKKHYSQEEKEMIINDLTILSRLILDSEDLSKMAQELSNTVNKFNI